MPSKSSRSNKYLTTPFAVVIAVAVVSTSLLAYGQMSSMLGAAIPTSWTDYFSRSSVPSKVGGNTSFGNIGTTPVALPPGPLRCSINLNTDNSVEVTVNRNFGPLGDTIAITLWEFDPVTGKSRVVATMDVTDATSKPHLKLLSGESGKQYAAVCTPKTSGQTPVKSPTVTVPDTADLIVDSITLEAGGANPTIVVVVKNQGKGTPPSINDTMVLTLAYVYNGSSNPLITPQTVSYNLIGPGAAQTYRFDSPKGYGTYASITATVNPKPLQVETPTSNNTKTVTNVSINPPSASSASTQSSTGQSGSAGNSCPSKPCYAPTFTIGSPQCSPVNIATNGTCLPFYPDKPTCDASLAMNLALASGTSTACNITATMGAVTKTITLP